MKNNKAVVANRNLYNYVCNKSWRRFRGQAYEEYREKWHRYPEEQILSSFPLHLDLDVTNACNLKCTMCARTLMIEKGSMAGVGFMDFDFYKSLIDQGKTSGLASVKLNFQGEPLLHPKIADMVSYAKQSGIVDIMINTNGTLMTAFMAESLLDAGIDNVFFSFDSADKEKYERIRVGADYDRVVNNIATFVDMKNRKEKRNVQVGVNAVLLERDDNEIDALISQWSQIADTITWGWDHHSALKKNYDKSKDLDQNPNSCFCCSQLWQRLIVNWDGQCVPCCLDVERDLVVGDARQSSLQDIWLKSPLYKMLREKHSSMRYRDIARCKRCSFALLGES
jgi:radical SAM protein with 4Fe4S-binding SPASM domain